MSILNLRFPEQDADGKSYPEHLRGHGLRPLGPIMQVTLSLTDDHRQALLDLGETLPEPVSGYAMIDTGAGSTCFDRRAAQKAKLATAGSTCMTSVTGSEIVPVYTGRLEVSGFTGITTASAWGNTHGASYRADRPRCAGELHPGVQRPRKFGFAELLSGTDIKFVRVDPGLARVPLDAMPSLIQLSKRLAFDGRNVQD